MVSDCEIDDPELFTSKKHLIAKLSPLSIVKSLADKHKEVTFVEDGSQHKHPLLNQTMYVVNFSIKGMAEISGMAEDINK